MRSSQIFVRKNPIFSECPGCLAHHTLRYSRSRSIVERLVKLSSAANTYRCKVCGWRGYIFSFSLTLGSLKNLLLYLFLAAASGFIIYKILQSAIK